MERDFDQEFAYDSAEGHTFILGGQKFHTLPAPTSQAWLALKDEKGLAGTIAFIRKIIVPEERDAFDALLSDETASVIVTVHQLDAIAVWLFELGSERPTTAPVSSSTGRESTSE